MDRSSVKGGRLVLLIALFLGPAFTPAIATTNQQDVSVDGISLHYYETGKGQPLLLLHGFGWSGKQWDPFIPSFAEHYRVIVLDLPGNGGSTGWDEASYDYSRNAQRVLKFLDDIGVQQYDAIGASAGAITLLQMAIAQPQRIQRLILIGSSTTMAAKETQEWLRDNACAPETKEDMELELHYQTYGEKQILGLDRQFCKMKDDAITFTSAQLHTLKAETLVVHGDHDRLFPVEGALATYNELPNGYLWVVPNCSHIGVIKQPQYQQLFTTNALDFLAGKWAH